MNAYSVLLDTSAQLAIKSLDTFLFPLKILFGKFDMRYRNNEEKGKIIKIEGL